MRAAADQGQTQWAGAAGGTARVPGPFDGAGNGAVKSEPVEEGHAVDADEEEAAAAMMTDE